MTEATDNSGANLEDIRRLLHDFHATAHVPAPPGELYLCSNNKGELVLVLVRLGGVLED